MEDKTISIEKIKEFLRKISKTRFFPVLILMALLIFGFSLYKLFNRPEQIDQDVLPIIRLDIADPVYSLDYSSAQISSNIDYSEEPVTCDVYRVQVNRDKFATIKSSILDNNGEHKTSGGGDSQTFYFTNGAYLRVSKEDIEYKYYRDIGSDGSFAPTTAGVLESFSSDYNLELKSEDYKYESIYYYAGNETELIFTTRELGNMMRISAIQLLEGKELFLKFGESPLRISVDRSGNLVDFRYIGEYSVTGKLEYPCISENDAYNKLYTNDAELWAWSPNQIAEIQSIEIVDFNISYIALDSSSIAIPVYKFDVLINDAIDAKAIVPAIKPIYLIQN